VRAALRKGDMSEHDMVWLRLNREHQRRANICAAKHRELVKAGAYGPTVTYRLFTADDLAYRTAAAGTGDEQT
jgi:hypothetical protein